MACLLHGFGIYVEDNAETGTNCLKDVPGLAAHFLRKGERIVARPCRNLQEPLLTLTVTSMCQTIVISIARRSKQVVVHCDCERSY